jgi:hypothetical protein
VPAFCFLTTVEKGTLWEGRKPVGNKHGGIKRKEDGLLAKNCEGYGRNEIYLANRGTLKGKNKWRYLIFKPWVFEV